jgi:Ankyrin repeats (3 copies)
MYPNPQEALPLTPRPNLDQYRKLAKELVKACKSDDADAIRSWTRRWIERLRARDAETAADRLEKYARTKMSEGACALTTAQFVIARAHGFLSWPKFATHLESLGRAGSPVSAYEQAVEAIVSGDTVTLTRLLRKYPKLVRARSTREHGATLLHYVSANGVEGYRQVSPQNAAAIAAMLLAAGADVDATTDVYDGKCTALGLVATSSPPYAAGVQRDVIDVLLNHGAHMDLRGSVGHDGSLVQGCLANGQPEAAQYLASRGAPLDLEGAAGIGRVDAVRDLLARAAPSEVRAAFGMACAYGRAEVVEFLLTHGVDVDEELKSHGDGHTGLHVAAFHGQLDAVRTLLRHGASVDAIDKTWKTAPITWAMTGKLRASHPGQYDEVIDALAAAGHSK